MSEKILLVDDDPHILRGYTRQLQDQFQIEAASSGKAGLLAIANKGPFAVIVADMRMPEMDGIQFFERTTEAAPDSVRMMLTGNADLQTAIEAVNRGSLFRFLTKPCPLDAFSEALRAGIKQYQLVISERQLLEGTLNGSIKVLIEVLSLASPTAFSRANRTARVVEHMAINLDLPQVWQFKLAALLSQIGCITLPPGVLDKINAQMPLSASEQHMYDVHPTVGYQLLINIPRLKLIAQMIEHQHHPATNPILPQNVTTEEDVALIGAQLLKTALDFDQQIRRGASRHEALAVLRRQPNSYNPHLLVALIGEIEDSPEFESEIAQGPLELMVADLKTGMVIEQDVWSKNGILLVHKGQEVTLPVFMRLRNFAQGTGVEEPISVRAGGGSG